MARHLIGLMVGTEKDWPEVFEALVRDALGKITIDGEEHSFAIERVSIEPFDLRSRPRYDLVIDRLSYWYPYPREWLKKVAMMDEVYLLNNPFTFQSMEKHTAFCGMMRLGLKIPETWLLPSKIGPDHEKYEETARQYNRMFDLGEIAARVGYPHYIKPYDGGAWVGVTRITNREELESAYDESGRGLMHLQRAVDPFEVFARSLSIGPQTMVMNYRPDKPMHERYAVEHDFLSDDVGLEVITIGRLINAFFRWEFNSCETLVQGGEVYPIDFANAVPDVSLTSLHFYFPWAMMALVRWTAFCVATGRQMSIDMNKRRYFAIADDEDLPYNAKLAEYSKLSAEYFDEERFREFCEVNLSGFDDAAIEYFGSARFDDLLVRSVRDTFPEHETEEFTEHFRGLVSHWVGCEGAG